MCNTEWNQPLPKSRPIVQRSSIVASKTAVAFFFHVFHGDHSHPPKRQKSKRQRQQMEEHLFKSIGLPPSITFPLLIDIRRVCRRSCISSDLKPSPVRREQIQSSPGLALQTQTRRQEESLGFRGRCWLLTCLAQYPVAYRFCLPPNDSAWTGRRTATPGRDKFESFLTRKLFMGFKA